MSESMDLAVIVKNVDFEYINRIKVLDNLSVVVPKGKIFALLGPNGCGKTTIIRLILGRLQPKVGTIDVFGVRNTSKCFDIKGELVGYMPQELALFEEFTIEEILRYYGTIYHLKNEILIKRIESLIEVFDLPEKSRPISRLSGGQQRRVSIAITMIHRPELIILDEPTVGVDSLLRKKIWNYLENLCRNFGQTVIITTHYIEEARSAANVAFMKSGSVLKQADPQILLKRYKCSTLEEVFIRLCYQEINKINNSKEIGRQSIKPVQQSEQNLLNNYIKNPNKLVDLQRVKAMLWKYYILTIRRPLFLVMFYFIPLLALTAMRLSIGQNPYNIPLAVYNGDEDPLLSQLFLNSIDKTYINLKRYPSNGTAQQSVVNGCNYMAIMFQKRFSQTFEVRIENLLDVNKEDLDSSEIKISADLSNIALIIYIFKYIFNAFEIFSQKLSQIYGYDIYRFVSPINVEKPIYGDLELNVTAHFGPSLLIVMAQSLPMIVSALQIIYDRKNTSLERVFCAGIKPIEFFTAHMIQNLILIATQVLFSMFLSFVVFENRQMGSYIEVYIMLSLQGILGTAIGLMGSLLLFDEVSVAVGLTGLMVPMWIMSGVLWPIESIPYYFRYISDLSPITQPLDALRSVMLRGWTYNRVTVQMGYFVSLIYALVITFFNIILFHKFSDKALKLNIWSFTYK